MRQYFVDTKIRVPDALYERAQKFKDGQRSMNGYVVFALTNQVERDERTQKRKVTKCQKKK